MYDLIYIHMEIDTHTYTQAYAIAETMVEDWDHAGAAGATLDDSQIPIASSNLPWLRHHW